MNKSSAQRGKNRNKHINNFSRPPPQKQMLHTIREEKATAEIDVCLHVRFCEFFILYRE